MEACRGMDIDVDLIVTLGSHGFPTSSTIIRTKEIINLKKHLPQERRQIFPTRRTPAPLPTPSGPWVPPGGPGTAQQTGRGRALPPTATAVIKPKKQD